MIKNCGSVSRLGIRGKMSRTTNMLNNSNFEWYFRQFNKPSSRNHEMVNLEMKILLIHFYRDKMSVHNLRYKSFYRMYIYLGTRISQPWVMEFHCNSKKSPQKTICTKRIYFSIWCPMSWNSFWMKNIEFIQLYFYEAYLIFIQLNLWQKFFKFFV